MPGSQSGDFPEDGADVGALEGMARVLTASGEFRVLRRFCPPTEYPVRYHDAGDGPTATALFVDVETTGLRVDADPLIELAMVPFTYRKDTGLICGMGAPLVGVEDPDRPVPPAVTALTGLTDEAVRGRRIDDEAVGALLASATLVVAHNAAFDRRVLERRFPMFAGVCWACSRDDVPWADHGVRGTKLDYLLLERCGVYFDAHRAEADCLAALHLLSAPFACGTLPFQLLLASARRIRFRVWAVDTPIAVKDCLKERGYRWPGDAGAQPRTWYRDCSSPEEAAAERAWLAEHAYRRTPARSVVQRLTARDRYSVRC
jgi:DNA polymerase-3 subunit epsilon